MNPILQDNAIVVRFQPVGARGKYTPCQACTKRIKSESLIILNSDQVYHNSGQGHRIRDCQTLNLRLDKMLKQLQERIEDQTQEAVLQQTFNPLNVSHVVKLLNKGLSPSDRSADQDPRILYKFCETVILCLECGGFKTKDCQKLHVCPSNKGRDFLDSRNMLTGPPPRFPHLLGIFEPIQWMYLQLFYATLTRLGVKQMSYGSFGLLCKTFDNADILPPYAPQGQWLKQMNFHVNVLVNFEALTRQNQILRLGPRGIAFVQAYLCKFDFVMINLNKFAFQPQELAIFTQEEKETVFTTPNRQVQARNFQRLGLTLEHYPQKFSFKRQRSNFSIFHRLYDWLQQLISSQRRQNYLGVVFPKSILSRKMIQERREHQQSPKEKIQEEEEEEEEEVKWPQSSMSEEQTPLQQRPLPHQMISSPEYHQIQNLIFEHVPLRVQPDPKNPKQPKIDPRIWLIRQRNAIIDGFFNPFFSIAVPTEPQPQIDPYAHLMYPLDVTPPVHYIDRVPSWMDEQPVKLKEAFYQNIPQCLNDYQKQKIRTFENYLKQTPNYFFSKEKSQETNLEQFRKKLNHFFARFEHSHRSGISQQVENHLKLQMKQKKIRKRQSKEEIAKKQKIRRAKQRRQKLAQKYSQKEKSE